MERVEDASELRLGPEFDNESCLSNAEVCILLEQSKKKYEEEERAIPEVFEETLIYCKRFTQIKEPEKNQAAVEALREELENLAWVGPGGEDDQIKLHQFELTAAMNLKVDDADEAMALIPSLMGKLEEDAINDVLARIIRASGQLGILG